MFTRRAFQYISLVLGIGSLAVVAEVSGGALGIAGLSAMSPHLQFALLAAGIIFIVYGLSATSGVSFTVSFQPRTSHVALSTIFLLALILRLWANGDAIRVLVDELNFVSGMTNFWKTDQTIGLLTPMDSVSPFTWLFPYWQSNFVALFGRNMAAIRAVSAVVGALNIPALYLLAAALFNRRVGLLAAFLLATFPPHIHYSRIALLSITDPLMGTLALAFLARGMAHGRRLDFALGGAFLGLTQYFFEGGRLVFPLLAVGWIVGAWLVGRGENSTPSPQPLSPEFNGEGLKMRGAFIKFNRIQSRKLATMLLAAVLVGAPVYYAWIALGRPLTGRMDESGLGAGYWGEVLAAPLENVPRYLADHLIPAFSSYAFTPDQSPYYGGSTALVLPILVPVFLVGVGIALWRIRQPGMMLAVWWLAGVAVGNSLLRNSGASTRYLVAFPAIALVLAIGVDAIVAKAAGARYRAWAAAAALVIGLVGVGYYFGAHLSAFDNQFRLSRPYPDLEDTVYRSLNFPAGTGVHVVSMNTFDRSFAANFLAFFRDDVKGYGYLSGELDAARLDALPRDADQAFFIQPEDVGTLALLQARYQSALEGPFFSPYNGVPEKQLILFYVQAVE